MILANAVAAQGCRTLFFILVLLILRFVPAGRRGDDTPPGTSSGFDSRCRDGVV